MSCLEDRVVSRGSAYIWAKRTKVREMLLEEVIARDDTTSSLDLHWKRARAWWDQGGSR